MAGPPKAIAVPKLNNETKQKQLEAAEQARLLEMQRMQGRSSTILTGLGSFNASNNSNKKSLLGG